MHSSSSLQTYHIASILVLTRGSRLPHYKPPNYRSTIMLITRICILGLFYYCQRSKTICLCLLRNHFRGRSHRSLFSYTFHDKRYVLREELLFNHYQDYSKLARHSLRIAGTTHCAFSWSHQISSRPWGRGHPTSFCASGDLSDSSLPFIPTISSCVISNAQHLTRVRG